MWRPAFRCAAQPLNLAHNTAFSSGGFYCLAFPGTVIWQIYHSLTVVIYGATALGFNRCHRGHPAGRGCRRPRQADHGARGSRNRPSSGKHRQLQPGKSRLQVHPAGSRGGRGEPGTVIPGRAPQGAPAAAAPARPAPARWHGHCPRPRWQRGCRRAAALKTLRLPPAGSPRCPAARPCPARPAGAAGSGTGTPGRRRPRGPPTPQHLVQAVDFLGGIDHFATAGALGVHFAAPLGRRLRRAAVAEVAARRDALDGAAGGRSTIPCTGGDAGGLQRLRAGEEVIGGGCGGSGAPADCGSAACASGRAGSRRCRPRRSPPAPAASPVCLRARLAAPRAAWLTPSPALQPQAKPSPPARPAARGGQKGRASAAPQPPRARRDGCGGVPAAPPGAPARDSPGRSRPKREGRRGRWRTGARGNDGAAGATGSSGAPRNEARGLAVRPWAPAGRGLPPAANAAPASTRGCGTPVPFPSPASRWVFGRGVAALPGLSLAGSHQRSRGATESQPEWQMTLLGAGFGQSFLTCSAALWSGTARTHAVFLRWGLL